VLVSAAVCPHPPLLVPDLAGSATAAELDDLRSACDGAIEAIRATEPERLVVVGAGESTRRYAPGSAGSFAQYGADVAASLPGPAVVENNDRLPLSLAVASWLLGRAGWTGDVPGLAVGESSLAEECRRLGIQLAQETDRLALLVMGDGSAGRPSAAPAFVDPRADGFDSAVADALRTADPAALMALDPTLGTELRAAGRAPWQVLAGAAGDAVFDAELLYDDAPYGVGYLVAVWERHG
jgi:hypothetical protein